MRHFLLLVVSLITFSASAQTPPPDLQDGVEFRNWIKANFYTGIINSIVYSDARDKLYGYVENFNDSVECIYSGVKVRNLRGNEVGVLPPLNTEHSVPQSFYNSQEPMRGDLHILFPCYADWNTLRSNYKFKEIPDDETDDWIRGTVKTSTQPSSDIDNYSEFDDKQFDEAWEPREIRKGDIARAAFYFYTMYPNYDIRSLGDTETFCKWHEEDLPDDREKTRNERIALYQDNINPYITNPEWANNVYGCKVPITPTNIKLRTEQLTIYPNPTSDVLSIELKDWHAYPLNASITSLDGRTNYTFNINSYNTLVDVADFAKGNYVLVLKDEKGNDLGQNQIIIQ